MNPEVDLSKYSVGDFDRGRPAWVEALWLLAQALFVRSWLPGSAHRRLLLRLFGAQIGQDVQIKPGVRVKFPWRLAIGDHSWIGEDVWIDNLAEVVIGAHCCLSQGAYLCTGSHDKQSDTFDLITDSIHIADRAWLAAHSRVAPGVQIGTGAVLAMGSIANKDLEPWTVNAGIPAVPRGARTRQSIGS